MPPPTWLVWLTEAPVSASISSPTNPERRLLSCRSAFFALSK
jgi:hypothetical protein